MNIFTIYMKYLMVLLILQAIVTCSSLATTIAIPFLLCHCNNFNK